MPKEKVTSAIWSPLDEGIITGHENGDLCQWELKVRRTVLFAVHVSLSVCQFDPVWSRALFPAALLLLL